MKTRKLGALLARYERMKISSRLYQGRNELDRLMLRWRAADQPQERSKIAKRLRRLAGETSAQQLFLYLEKNRLIPGLVSLFTSVLADVLLKEKERHPPPLDFAKLCQFLRTNWNRPVVGEILIGWVAEEVEKITNPHILRDCEDRFSGIVPVKAIFKKRLDAVLASLDDPKVLLSCLSSDNDLERHNLIVSRAVVVVSAQYKAIPARRWQAREAYLLEIWERSGNCPDLIALTEKALL